MEGYLELPGPATIDRDRPLLSPLLNAAMAKEEERMRLQSAGEMYFGLSAFVDRVAAAFADMGWPVEVNKVG